MSKTKTKSSSKSKSSSKAKKDKSKKVKTKPEASDDSAEEQDSTLQVAEENEETEGAEGKKKVSVEFDSAIQRDEAVSYFETLVAGLKKGSIHLRQNGQELTLTPPSQLEVRVKASRKKEKEKLSFEIYWRTSSANDLQISSE